MGPSGAPDLTLAQTNNLALAQFPMVVQTVFIVPHWNGYPLLARCLASLLAQTARDFAVLVVDNGSTDGSADLVARDFPSVSVFRLGRNLGFAAAANRGIAASRSAEIAFVNNDVRLRPDWLERMREGLASDPSLGACAGKLLLDGSADRRERASGPPPHRGGLQELRPPRTVGPVCDRASGPPAPRIASAGNLVFKSGFGRDRGYGEEDRGQFDRREEVFWASGAACLVPRRLFAEIGGWDDSFFAYFEDIDLGLRARLRGYRCFYLPEAVGWHVGGATGGKLPRLGASLLFRNALMVALKDFPGPLLRRHAGFILFAQLRALAYLARRGYGREAWRGELFLARNLRQILAERRKIQAARTVPISAVAAVLSPEDFSAAWRGWLSALSG